MTMATRCSACGTVFRVVPDQLRVSAGWVRCGRCGEAFNAAESLVELPSPDPYAAAPAAGGAMAAVAATAVTKAADVPEPDAGAPAPPPEQTSTTPPPADASPCAEMPIAAADLPIPADDEPSAPGPDAPVVAGSDEGSAAQSGASAPAGDASLVIEPGFEEGVWVVSDGATTLPPAFIDTVGGFAGGEDNQAAAAEPTAAAPTDPPSDGRVEPTLDADAAVAAVADDGAGALPAGAAPEAPGADAADAAARPADAGARPADEGPAVAPSFLRRAEQAERWRRPWVRALLSLGVLAAALGLAAQAAYVHREWLAAVWPPARPLLEQACTWLECRIGEYRQIESLGVESSGLLRIEGTSLYRLSVVLRNRAPIELAAPAIDLSLTDAQGRLIARRVLTLTELGLPLRSLKAGSELPIQVSLGVADRTVSGYTVEIFYP